MDDSADARRIFYRIKRQQEVLTPIKNNLSPHNLSVEDATELALDRPLWRLLAASRATH